MINRLNFGRDPEGERLLDHSDKLEITLHRLAGKVCYHFRLSGDVGNVFGGDDDDEDAEGSTGGATADDLVFLRKLVERFEQRRQLE